MRKANRIIDKAWRANPHPELARPIRELRSGDAARDRLKRIEALAKKVPGHIEGALAVARAALGAQEFAKARAALAPYLQAPTKRIALLMAEIERAEKNDEGRAREWVARALARRARPGLDRRRLCLRSLAAGVARHRASRRAGMAGAAVRNVERARNRARTAAGLPATEPPVEVEAAPPTAMGVAPAEETPLKADPKAEAKLEPKPEPIIPLVHAPDDPGTDLGEEGDASAGRISGWRKIFG